MGNGVISIRENDMQVIANHLKKNANNLTDTTSDASTMFKSITKTGLFSNGLNKISKQMNSLSKGIDKLGVSVLNQYEDMANTETSLKSKAESINIPLDFVTNDSSNEITMKSGKLEKEDGKKVNASDDTKEEELVFDSVIDFNENLKNIVKDYEDLNGEIKIKGNGIKLGNINNRIKTKKADEISDSIIKTKTLEKVKNDNELGEISKIDEYKLSEKELKALNKDLKVSLLLEDFPYNVEKINLRSVNLNGFQNSVFKGDYKINKKNLYNIR